MARRKSNPMPPSLTGRPSVGIPDTSSATVIACEGNRWVSRNPFQTAV